MELNNREIAILVWSAVFFGWTFSKAEIRKSFAGVVRAVLARQILMSLAIMTIYVILCAILLASMEIWSWINLKATIVWVVMFAIVTMSDINRITEDDTFFRKTIRDTVGATVIVGFIAGYYTFSLPAELILVPVLTAITLAYVVSQSRPVLSQVENLLTWVLAFVGLGLIGYGIFQISRNSRDFATLDTGREFIIPILLSILFLPFIYTLSIYVTYERVFLRLHFAIKDRRVRTYAQTNAILAFGFDLEFLRRWARNMALTRPDTNEDVRGSIREIMEVRRREKYPPIVPPSEGWSPYAAMEFLREEGLATGDYHRSFDEWFASSSYLSVGDTFLPDHITYYVEGDELAATRLKLTLDVNNPNDPQAAEQRFFTIARSLLQRAVGEEVGNDLSDQISSTGNTSAVVQDKDIRITKDDWPGGIPGGYSLKLTIEHRVG